MLKHKDLIEQLTVAQKIALLVDVGGHAKEQIDIPGLSHLCAADLWASNITQEGERLFPSAEALANSWDTTLFSEVAAQLVELGTKKETNLFVLPETKAPCSVYGKGLADDPILISELIRATSTALQQKGAGVCMHAPSLLEDDVKCLQNEVDARMLFERVAMPFHQTVESTSCRAALLPSEEAPEAYRGINNAMLHHELPKAVATISTDVLHEQTVSELLAGRLLLGASATALETALENYHRIRQAVEEGGATVEEMNASLLDGSAISEEMLDEALDRRIELSNTCDAMIREAAENGTWHSMPEALQATALRAARESIVLLKNENKMLPLSKKLKLAVIGDIVFDNEESTLLHFDTDLQQEMQAAGYQLVGSAKGYRLERDRSEELIDEAVSVAKGADAVMVFLGMGKRREALVPAMRSWHLPANQLALFDALSRTGKKIITVIVGKRLPAMAFDRRANAVLLMPGEGARLSTALREILTGACNPSGRLTFEGHDDPDVAYREAQRQIRLGKKKTGPMIGYRYSVSEKMTVKYPFGFGLSYSEVAYTDLHVDNKAVHVTLHNKSKIGTIETVQLYMGNSQSAILRPRMELKSFVRVPLRPGERRTVSLPLSNLGIYDPRTRNFVVENGIYEIYVGASSANINMTVTVKITGQTLRKQNYRLSDYLHTVSDIRSNRYVMEGFCKPMKTRAALKTLGTLLIMLTLFVDIMYATCIMLNFLSVNSSLGIAAVANLISLGLGALFLFIYHKIHARDVQKQTELEREATRTLFADAERVKGESLEELFVEEFDIPEQHKQQENESYHEGDEGLYAYMAVDADLPTMAADLEIFLAERGLVVDVDTVKTLLSSIMTSRLLIVRAELQGVLEQLVGALAEFFGTESYFDSFANCIQGESTMLYAKLADGTLRETQVLHALLAAQQQRDKACFVGVGDMHLAKMGALLMPYIRYFSNPKSSYTIRENDNSVAIPTNIWFVLGVANGQSLEDIEPFVANFATVVDLPVEPCSVSEEKSHVKSVSCAEMEALVYRSKKKIEVDEDLWKAVDRLELFVKERAPYHIGNKLFLQLERYLAVYTACGGHLQHAMDSAIATKLLPAIISLLKDKSDAENEIDLLQTVESIFGEENIADCRYMLKRIVLQMDGVEQTLDAATAEEQKHLEEEQQASQIFEAANASEPTVDGAASHSAAFNATAWGSTGNSAFHTTTNEQGVNTDVE